MDRKIARSATNLNYTNYTNPNTKFYFAYNCIFRGFFYLFAYFSNFSLLAAYQSRVLRNCQNKLLLKGLSVNKIYNLFIVVFDDRPITANRHIFQLKMFIFTNVRIFSVFITTTRFFHHYVKCVVKMRSARDFSFILFDVFRE